MGDSVIDLAAVSAGSLPTALDAVAGYLKVASMLWIRALGEPTSDGIVITRWSRAASVALRDFCRRHDVDRVLLRIDKRGNRWATRRGGYILPMREVRETVLELSQEATIAVLLEPLSPYKDRYCLACVTIPSEDRIIVEVMGPGFDTSDLLRSDVPPHERFEVDVRLRKLDDGALPRFRYLRTHIVSQSGYQSTVEERLAKIGSRLMNPAFPRQPLESASVDRSDLKEGAMAHLRRTRETVLLKHLYHYRPISARYLSRFVRGTLRILVGLARRGAGLGSATFSGTFTTSGRFIFWDFFPADAGEAKMLYKSR